MAKLVSKKGKGKSIPGVPKKYAKVPGIESVVEELNSFGQEDLKKTIIQAEQSINEQTKLRDEDEKLTAAKALANDLKAGYNDSIKYQNAKIQYALYCLEMMGENVEELKKRSEHSK